MATGDAKAAGFRFEAWLKPHRSLSQRGFLIVMFVACCFSFVAGIGFALHGAWPVFGFFGLDLLLLYLAFRWSYAQGRAAEIIRIENDELTVTRILPSGKWRSWRFQPYWVRVGAPDLEGGRPDLILTSHGQSLVIGSFLSPGERAETGRVLMDALSRYRESLIGRPA